jgi:hypothetical protein
MENRWGGGTPYGIPPWIVPPFWAVQFWRGQFGGDRRNRGWERKQEGGIEQRRRGQ